jgi:hypothetical protein
MVIGAMIGMGINRQYNNLQKEIEDKYTKLSNLNPNDPLLTLIDRNSKAPFEFRITERLEKKYPFTKEEEQARTFHIFKANTLLEKYAQDLEKKLQ